MPQKPQTRSTASASEAKHRYLPISCSTQAGTWSALPAGMSWLRSGRMMPIASTNSTAARRLGPMPCQRKRVIIRPSSFDGAPFERKQPARPALDEQDDEHQHKDLAQHGAGIGFEELVDDAERGRTDQGAEEIADAAEHHDHEGVDDVALAEIGADIVDLAQRHAGEPRDARAQAEGQRVDARRAD